MIYARNVLFNYPNEKTLSFPDLEIKEKEHCILLGNSGSGKTTFLHILAGLLSPTQGEVIIQGKDITSMSGREMDQFRGQNIGIVFQTAHLIPAFSVEENLKAAQYFSNRKINQNRIMEVLKSLDIENLKDKKVNQISSGQAQRVAIGRAVINNPTMILADEPTSSLDDDNCQRVLDLLLSQASLYHSNLIITTHDHRIKAAAGQTIYLQQE